MKAPRSTFVIPTHRTGRIALSNSDRATVIVERWDAAPEGDVLGLDIVEVWATYDVVRPRPTWHTTLASALEAACRLSVPALTLPFVGAGQLARRPVLPTRLRPFPKVEVRTPTTTQEQ